MVIFSHVSVSHSVHRGEGVSADPPGKHPPLPGKHPHPGQTPPWADTHPCPVHAGTHPLPTHCLMGYGQQVGGKYPTGMHTCLIWIHRTVPPQSLQGNKSA